MALTLVQALRKEIVGKEITLGFGANKNRIVLEYEKKRITFYGSDSGLEIGKIEPITTRITPHNVPCNYLFFMKRKMLGFQLGRHRFLSACYMGKEDLHVVYLPDEADLEYRKSEFMNKCEERGWM